MIFNIRGDKLEITDAIRKYAYAKIGKLDKYFENPEQLAANILVKVNGINQVVEVTIPIKKGIIRAEADSADVYASIDLVVDKLERQIRKNKTRMHHKPAKEIIETFVDFKVSDEESTVEKIVKRKIVDDKPMSEEEAILQMNLTDHDFFIFKDMKTKTAKVVYRRKDKNYGIIEMK